MVMHYESAMLCNRITTASFFFFLVNLQKNTSLYLIRILIDKPKITKDKSPTVITALNIV